MPLFAAIGLDHPPHSMEKRDTNRDAHRAYVWDNDAPIRFVGVLLDDEDNQCGSLYIFEAESADEVRAWLNREPFVQDGVYKDIVVRRFMTGKNLIPVQDWPARAAATGTQAN